MGFNSDPRVISRCFPERGEAPHRESTTLEADEGGFEEPAARRKPGLEVGPGAPVGAAGGRGGARGRGAGPSRAWLLRASRAGGEGYRNGCREGWLKTSEGEVGYAVPQVREVSPELINRIREALSGKTEELERLAVEMFARGCSYRDIEETFRGEDGRSLEPSGADPGDRGSVEGVRGVRDKGPERGSASVHVRGWAGGEAASGFAPRGGPGSVDDHAGGLEGTAPHGSWDEGVGGVLPRLPQDMNRRGLRDPLLVATDGAPGLQRAAEECFPRALRQRCLAHRVRNILAKLPEDAVDEFRQAAYEAPSPAMARALRADLGERFGKEYPSAVACFEEGFEERPARGVGPRPTLPLGVGGCPSERGRPFFRPGRRGDRRGLPDRKRLARSGARAVLGRGSTPGPRSPSCSRRGLPWRCARRSSRRLRTRS